ncbi:TIGR02611 family protein [Agromyces sp. SYSU K20354]|uniref:TIGR02611 family protein n=1 Tax=Agromyces cavernae TaxID=2898659 RepID=UPI001E42F733|nr:TIGR02611 family protein [Agromyces cavernae]MCD2442650.1 TIGR02611 family protein [Agromyces cavernae]
MVTERELQHEIAEGERPDRPIRRLLRGIRRRIEGRPALRRAYRLVVAMLGGTIAVLGLLLVPLPGPGWLIVFLGLAILGTEFAWAKRLAAFTKRQLARFWAWSRARRAERSASAST